MEMEIFVFILPPRFGIREHLYKSLLMPTLLDRHWPKLALLLTVSLLAGLFFAPALAGGFAMPLIALMLGMGLLLLALRHWRTYRAGKLSRRELARNIFIETASLLLVFMLARFAGGLVAGFVGAEYGWLLALLSAIVVGAAAGPSIRLRHSGQVWLSTRRWGGGSRGKIYRKFCDS
jgi:hypothetical protein